MNTVQTTSEKINRIFEMEDSMLQMPQAELETRHHFAPGVYIRELRIPAGVCLTGAVHKTEHLNICVRGCLCVVSATADDKWVRGGDIFCSPPGTKRTAYVSEDTVWLTVHATEETDIPTLEKMLVHNDRNLLDRDDYAKLEEEFRISPNYLKQLEAIPVTFLEFDGLELADSEIHGTGVFASMDLSEGFTAPALVDSELQQWSRYCNHSATPNATMESETFGNTDLVLSRDVLKGEEIVVDYRQVLSGIVWSDG